MKRKSKEQRALELATLNQQRVFERKEHQLQFLLRPVRTREVQIEKALDRQFAVAIKEAADRVVKARAEFDQWRVATAHKRAPWPVGSRVCYWRSYGWPTHEWKIKRRGVVQIFRAGDPVSKVLGRWNQPKPGDVIIRLLKKDGGMSVEFEPVRDNGMPGWLPEGQKPKKGK